MTVLLGNSVGTEVGAHVCSSGKLTQHKVPNAFPDKIRQLFACDMALTSAGISPQSLFAVRYNAVAVTLPSSDGIGPVSEFELR
jgi:hypothetical protein